MWLGDDLDAYGDAISTDCTYSGTEVYNTIYQSFEEKEEI